MNEAQKDSAFLVTNASGRHINLLNDDYQGHPVVQHHVITAPSPPISEVSDETATTSHQDNHTNNNNNNKRKYHCTEPGCTKSFTTSGHLARHNRIHTGEKNFPCLFPGCQSKFSRQDNMMQHYRTHMSPKSKRAPKKNMEEIHPRPKLHAHQRIRSDPYILDRPLTIDQHLNNYRQSLYHQPPDMKYMPSPLIRNNKPSSSSSSSSSFSSPPPPNRPLPITVPHHNNEITFYRHQPLTYSRNTKVQSLPYTLLHPSKEYIRDDAVTPVHHLVLDEISPEQPTHPYDNNSSTTTATTTTTGLSQLAHIISTFS